MWAHACIFQRATDYATAAICRSTIQSQPIFAVISAGSVFMYFKFKFILILAVLHIAASPMTIGFAVESGCDFETGLANQYSKPSLVHQLLCVIRLSGAAA